MCLKPPIEITYLQKLKCKKKYHLSKHKDLQRKYLVLNIKNKVMLILTNNLYNEEHNFN